MRAGELGWLVWYLVVMHHLFEILAHESKKFGDIKIALSSDFRECL